MFQQILTLCLLLLGTVRISVSKDTLMRVINGEDVAEGQFPYVVVLLRMYSYVSNFLFRTCTGSMLTEDWGVSAGHCKPAFSKEYSTYAWYSNFTQYPQFTKKYILIVEWHVHPSFRALHSEDHPDLLVENDISLFRIEPKLKLTKYGRVSALDRDALLGLPVSYIAGGATTIKHRYTERLVRPLKKGEGAVVSCNVETSIKSKHILCINPKCVLKLQFGYYGDSGSPLLFEEQIVGVCSFGVNSSDVYQTIFVPLSPYIDWISFIIRNKVALHHL